MLYKINCSADIAAQDATYPTYKGIDCDLHINANDDGFHGKNIDCTLSIIRTLADACIAKFKGIRTRVTINNVDVTAALTGDITIHHNKNMISVFNLKLGDDQYSPLKNANIAVNKVVIITTTINGFGMRVFTGLIEDINVDYTLDNFEINISGSDYGKKLRDKKMTLVSIQDSALSHYRGALIKYLASQAGINNVNAPGGSYTRIDHSFNTQSILDMITKELTIDSYWWWFDENGVLQIALDNIKTNTTTYPTADWTYGEDQIVRLELNCTDADIINTITILGTMYETAIEVSDSEDSPSNQYISPSDGYMDNNLYTKVKDFALAENILAWSETGGEFEIEVHDGIRNVYGAYQQPHYWGGDDKYYYYTIDITCDSAVYCEDFRCECSEGFTFHSKSVSTCMTDAWLFRFVVKRFLDASMQGLAGSLKITIDGKWLYSQSEPDPDEEPLTSAIVDDEEVASPTYEYEYDQVAALVIDSNSIAKYGERKPHSGDTLEFPLAENTDQCKGIGKKIIRDSHRLLKQPDFEVGYNPLLKIGQTIQITDKKTGHTENRWYVEEVFHIIGQSYGATRIGCVYYD